MKANTTQKVLCDVIANQSHFWATSNDITSTTHTSDIEEECFAALDGLLDDDVIGIFAKLLNELYWFVRKFDNK